MQSHRQAQTTLSPAGRRGWLAALLLRQPDRFLPRLAAAVGQWRALPRRLRRQLPRKAAAAVVGAALIFGLAGSAFFAPTALAAGINVDNGVVLTDPNDGLCSLSEAILNANTNSRLSNKRGECETGAFGPDTINLPINGNFLFETYQYWTKGNTALPVIDSRITIHGNGSTITRKEGSPAFRIMGIDDTGDVTLSDVVISGGSSSIGGGIYLFEGELTIYNSTISHNTSSGDGGGIVSEGESAELTLINSVISHNGSGGHGGGLSSPGGTTTIIDSTISNNNAAGDGRGGGIEAADGVLRVIGSTISGNTAGGGGGGVYLFGMAGHISNSTISNNTSLKYGGGIANYALIAGYMVHITNTTITGNSALRGGGVMSIIGLSGVLTPTTYISRSIISGNGASYTGQEGHGMFASLSLNVIGHSGLTTSEAWYLGPSPGNHIFATSDGNHPTPLAGILDPALADNGGPTLTHNLAPGSPALDLIPDAHCEVTPANGLDQRGEERPFDMPGLGAAGAACDAGAVEFRPEPIFFMTAKKSGATNNNVFFDNADILRWDDGVWTHWFDGSVANPPPPNKPNTKSAHDINAFWVEDDSAGIFVASFTQNARVVNGILPKVDGMDLVRWDGSAFSLWFDGSDVSLNKKSPERIDALHVLPGSESPIGSGCVRYLLVSTVGAGDVPLFGGGDLKFGGEDVLGFCATSLGDVTTGHWHMVLDGSAVGLPKNTLDSISATLDGRTLYLMTSKPTPLGGPSTVFAYNRDTGEFTGPLFSAAGNGLGQVVNGLDVK